jgi:S-methylmethionine-dependent homocysteine/selenocysteine methylase
MSALAKRLERHDPVILDGATGTELQRRGVPMSEVAWSATALKEHAETVRQVHEDYIRAGAEIVTTNTYSAARHVLAPAGLGNEVRALNQKAVQLAKEARDRAAADRPVYIAGSLSTFGAANDRASLPSAAQERANYREQAEILVEAGVDLLLPENLYSIEQGGYAVEAAVATGLPTWIGFSCRLGSDGVTLLMTNRLEEQPFEEGLRAILPLGGQVAIVMHSTVEDTSPGLTLLAQHWRGPIGAYAHSGYFKMPNWQFVDVIAPEGYLAAAKIWVDDGIRIIGGCCGIGPDHIRALSRYFAAPDAKVAQA